VYDFIIKLYKGINKKRDFPIKKFFISNIPPLFFFISNFYNKIFYGKIIQNYIGILTKRKIFLLKK